MLANNRTYVYIYTCARVNMLTFLCVSLYTYDVYLHVNMCMCVCIHICTCACMCVHHIHLIVYVCAK